MKILIYHNLSSGYNDGAIHDFIRAFAEAGDEVCFRAFDKDTKRSTELLYDADAFDVVVASGGDGTVASAAYALRNTGIPILPFPAGTSNAAAMNLCSPDQPHALAKLAREGATLDFDMGEIQVGNATYGFLLVAGCGYDASIMLTAQQSKGFLGSLAYLQGAIANAMPTKSHFIITIDGKTIERDCLSVLLCNFSRLQFDIALTHENKPRDGLFDVLLLKGQNAFELVPALMANFLDKDASQGEGIEHLQAREISVIADPELPVQFDGEPLPQTTPVSARILPKAVRFIVSDEGYEAFSS